MFPSNIRLCQIKNMHIQKMSSCEVFACSVQAHISTDTHTYTHIDNNPVWDYFFLIWENHSKATSRTPPLSLFNKLVNWIEAGGRKPQRVEGPLHLNKHPAEDWRCVQCEQRSAANCQDSFPISETQVEFLKRLRSCVWGNPKALQEKTTAPDNTPHLAYLTGLLLVSAGVRE